MTGSLYKEKRKHSAVWVFRYRDEGVNRKEQLGTVAELTLKQAREKAEAIAKGMEGKKSPRTVEDLIEHYKANRLPQKAFSTQEAYKIYFDNWIIPAWGTKLFRSVKTMQVEDWLKKVERADGTKPANGTKSKIKNIMCGLWTHAMRYEFWNENPILLVEQSAKREREPDVLTADEINSLLGELADPCRTVAHVAACTGLRISELLALKWTDIRFDDQEIRPVRGIVDNHIGELKTDASGKAVPMDIALSEALLDWREICPYNQDSDFVFGSLEMKGKQPYWPDTMLHKVLKPAARRAKIAKSIGWHSFRRTYATLLVESGANVKDTQDLLRHANAKTTMDIYAQSIPTGRREAQGKVANQIFLPKRSGNENVVPRKVVSR
jgi:integrase